MFSHFTLTVFTWLSGTAHFKYFALTRGLPDTQELIRGRLDNQDLI